MKSSKELQEIVLASMLKNSYILASAKDNIELNFFSNIYYRLIFQSVSDYYEEYGDIPNAKSLLVELESEFEPNIGEWKELKEKCLELRNLELPNEDYLMEKVTTFIRRNRVEIALKDIVDKLEDGFDEGIEVVAEDLLESMEVSIKNSGVFKMDNLDKLKEAREKAIGTLANPTVVKSCIETINRKLQFNGYKPGDLALVVAPPGVGKTSFMVNEGVSASKQGFNVLHIFVGDMTEYDGFIRYAASFSGKSQGKITKLSVSDQKKFVDKYNLTGNFSRITILSFAAGEISVNELLEVVDRSQQEEEVHYDLIVVDYPDNLLQEDDMMYKSGGSIFNKLSYLARTNHSVVIAGSQPKIEFWEQEIIPKRAAAESSKKQQIIDVMLNLGKPIKAAPPATIFMAKVRRGEDGAIIRTKTDWARCRIEEITDKEYESLKAVAPNG